MIPGSHVKPLGTRTPTTGDPMTHGIRTRSTRLQIALITLLLCAPALRAADLQTESAAIQSVVAEIRGKPFEQIIPARTQGLEDFRAYVTHQLDLQIPPEISRDFDDIVRALGLYRGPRIDDYRALAASVMLSQAAAYYDPETDTFYEVMNGFPDATRRVIWAHELTHGLQDQSFDLERYLLDFTTGGTLSEDALLARQCVVEGEATYVMTLFSVRDMMGVVPERALLGPAIAMQAALSTADLKAALGAQGAATDLGPDMANAVAALDSIPPFLIDSLVGAYLKGQAFVYEVQAEGWAAVDSLFTTPPASTEQILHPERWRAGDVPVPMAWPDDLAERFWGWRLAREDVLGELQWRQVFAAHDVAAGDDAAAGWDGDRYAVFLDDAGRSLLLAATVWDDATEAAEFAAAYAEVQAAKALPDGAMRRVVHEGSFVGIVEGGRAELEPRALDLIDGITPD